jgi:hypothetical protein
MFIKNKQGKTQNQKSGKTKNVVIGLGLAMLTMPGIAFAELSSDWSEISWLYELLIGGLTGFGGKIIATLAFFVGLWLWIWEKKMSMAMGAFFIVFLILVFPMFIDAAFS